MTKKELSKAREIAEVMGSFGTTHNPPDVSALQGYGLRGFKPVHCTLRQIAYVMRWDCMGLNGQWDSESLDQFCKMAKRKFLLI